MAYFEDHPAALNGHGVRARLRIGQRVHRVGFPAVIWRVARVYRDAAGVVHATLVDEARPLDEKTLSAVVLLDRAQYRLI